jgi:hypothetical protein
MGWIWQDHQLGLSRPVLFSSLYWDFGHPLFAYGLQPFRRGIVGIYRNIEGGSPQVDKEVLKLTNPSLLVAKYMSNGLSTSIDN